ncbi:tRNA (adenosine(37)-N6)-threonylcarbamoyltransferase complex dimerization subunit type 1 TsaB [Streptococcus didelphis]|uniref:tRNA (Adenosine(37)-N6)-threonylcarbamoyltransferase complex dimerization subunit type 1 TsaB n=1 Tax=Streptococcus didelphis TaxID=102886 RepID=A0ABY9LFX6_9STRE|nr:tRNA (adenosine(37)-N6)-threonylcarbamoyltransferase complex dimerization subunit type 1 TsaB [Streptococcus didelphis]WMB27783.1 tRNA (adenosine(37)-N6)-threonylcarbamoyltransferase complex dimerization subunit type 1 TsaB [Streptococcus didelphis]WMB29757.1 tRNA (adenosine(37)-N6)-threonylcarbamoyltransferase complex dimerization subunit type 1 TsaB [Streptococcus didelphis]
MKTLAFDTSNKTLSLAILDNDSLLADLTLNIKKNHSISLMPAIDFLMQSIDLTPKDLDRIAVAQGPGSYTGLRVAVATAKTLAYSLKIDLVGISSLYALAAASSQPDALVVPLIDARRQFVYAGFYQNKKAIKQDTYIAFTDLLDSLKGEGAKKLIFVGETAPFEDQIKTLLPQAQIKASLPSAFEMGKAALSLEAQDVNAFVPNYLKRVEAEENWLKDHVSDQTDQYIKRV